ncbi:MAG: hypothetical protein HY246_02130 [Proteobacteria bacterium]|nr:hypothetical protein [Pseudomonadota bacterium]
MSFLLNFVSAALILPNLALACFFLAVGVVAGQTIGSLLKSVWSLLDYVPYMPYVVILALAAAAAIVVAMVRYDFLFPLTLVLLGGASVFYVCWVAWDQDLLQNPILLASLVGVALSGLQFWRVTQGVAT